MPQFEIRATIGALIMMSANLPSEAMTIEVRTQIDAPIHEVWSAVSDVYNVDKRLVPGMVVSTDIEPDDIRRVTFANGFVVREKIVAIDGDLHRIAYSSVGGQATFHMASMRVVEADEGCEIIWQTDFLPAELGDFIRSNMEQGSAIMKATLEVAVE